VAHFLISNLTQIFSMSIDTAIITAGGFGSRFLPAAKAIPKDLMPIINKPVMYYIIEQCLDAGITNIIIVSRPENTPIEKFFSKDEMLEQYLTKKGKTDALHEVQRICDIDVTIVHQDDTLPYGNARPLYTVKDKVAGKPFVYSYGDDLIFGDGAGIIELVAQYNKTQADAVLMCTKVDDSMVPKVGIVQPDPDHQYRVRSIVEKPSLAEAPSRLASVAAYVFTPKIFEYLDPNHLGAIGEFYLQAGLDEIIGHGNVDFVETTGQWLTVGDPFSYLKTTVEVALSRDDVRDDFVEYIRQRILNV